MVTIKEKLRRGDTVLGGWTLVGHPAVAEIIAGEGFDWLGVDLEHATTDHRGVYEICLAVRGSGCQVLARLHSCDPVQAKQVLDAGADGIIVPSVNTAEEAGRAVSMARFPPAGIRGASLCRASDYGRDFAAYFAGHNDRVFIAVMLEHVDAVARADEILATPGIDAAFIGPYDLSASMNLAGQLTDPRVVGAQAQILAACRRHAVPAGIHVVGGGRAAIEERMAAGYRFIACGLDTLFIIEGCRQMLGGLREGSRT